MTKELGGKIGMAGLDLPSACDICGRNRGHGIHTRCSRVRQERYRNQRKTESIQQRGERHE